jgi:hypothetical protein
MATETGVEEKRRRRRRNTVEHMCSKRESCGGESGGRETGRGSGEEEEEETESEGRSAFVPPSRWSVLSSLTLFGYFAVLVRT